MQQRGIQVSMGEVLMAKTMQRLEAMLEQVERQVAALRQENEALAASAAKAGAERASRKPPDEPAK